MKIMSNPFDEHKLDYICECCDLLIPRIVELRLSAMVGDIESLDAAFDAIRLIGRDVALTRKEIETRDDDEKSEAA